MNKLIIILVLLCGAAGCGEDEANLTTVPVAFGKSFHLMVDDRALVTDDANGARDSVWIRVTSIQDNRCPEGSYCVRAGEVQVDVLLLRGSQTEAVATCIGTDCGTLDEKYRNQTTPTLIDTTNVILKGTTYQLMLEDALPYPDATGQRANRALLRLIR